MAYKRHLVIEQAVKAIEQNGIATFEDIANYITPSLSTLYCWKLQDEPSIQEALQRSITTTRQTKKEEFDITYGIDKGQGYVYVIHCEGTNYYKVGFSKIKPYDRISSLQSGCPFNLNIIHIELAANFVQLERKAHQTLRKKKVRGEWFELDSKELVDLIKLLESYKIQQITLNVN